MDESLVRGEIVFRPSLPPLAGATVYVRLLDTSLADAPARVVAELVLAGAEGGGESSAIPFELRGEAADPRASYTVAVHVDLDGDGKISRGDYVNTESVPVLTRGHPNWARVAVKAVR